MNRILLDYRTSSEMQRPSLHGAACKLRPTHVFVLKDDQRLRTVIAQGLPSNFFEKSLMMQQYRNLAWRVATGQHVVIEPSPDHPNREPLHEFTAYINKVAQRFYTNKKLRALALREMRVQTLMNIRL